MPSPALTIGMSVYDDYDGFYFTIQALRLYHPEILDEVEFIAIDNNPAGPCAKAMKGLENWAPNFSYIPYGSRKGTAVRDLIFREAAGEFVLCIDSHVLFPPGAVARLIDYCRQHSESRDLVQGPLLQDDGNLSTHLEPKWWSGELFFGEWATDERGTDVDAPPFDIPMQGLGVFACRREAWPGFNPRFQGFGGEEGYIHEKIRRAGGRTLCLPFLRWRHRFARPEGIPFSPTWEERLRNYLIGYDELGQDPAPAIAHLEECLGKEAARPMVESVQAELAGPFYTFDAVYCYTLESRPDRWKAMQWRFRTMGIERLVRRFAAADTPLDVRVGRVLSHRRIIEEARKQHLKSVLICGDDVPFSGAAASELAQSLAEMRGCEWDVLCLGEYGSANELLPLVAGKSGLTPGDLVSAHAVAYRNSGYEAVLSAVPPDPVDAALWISASGHVVEERRGQ